jgi:exodeoxyribonuclease-5
MRFPNKIRNGARALLREACSRLKLTKDELLKLHAEAGDRHSFSASCLSIELGSAPASAFDERYYLIYDVINMFLIRDVREFWNHQTVKGESAEEQAITQLSTEVFGSAPVKNVIVPGARATIKWNAEQGSSFTSIFNWLKSKNRKPVFRLFGYAGTGKTTMIKEVAATITNGEKGIPKGEVMYASFTGKAASVMRVKGCAGAQTIHSLIYRPRIDPLTGKMTGKPGLNRESSLRHASLLIVDEVSMVDEEMAYDLLSFNVPILVVGDPFQIKPIKGYGFFIQARADAMLTSVERVAQENPLIWLATRIRNKQELKPGSYGDSTIYAPGTDIPDRLIAEADQILVGMHHTRKAMNRRYRMIHGYFDLDSQFPTKGERLMCTKNNKVTGVLNGTQWTCSTVRTKPVMRLKDVKKPLLGFEPTNIEGLHFRARSLDIFDQDGNPVIVNTVCSTHHFDENILEPPWRDIAGTDAWTFAYAGTVHKFQGSQADHTLSIDESSVFEDQVWQHRYTNLTRAAVSTDFFLT